MSNTPSLSQLHQPDAFLARHLGPDAAEQQAMLDTLGLKNRDDLIVQTVPPAIRLNRPLDLPTALDEQGALAKLKGYALKNELWTSLIGMGYYGTLTPPVILRNMLENPGWYTAYTPYQPEISQGRLEALLNFQQVTLDLTGLDLATASLLDEATAAAEAMALAKRVAKAKNANRFFVADGARASADAGRGAHPRRSLRLRRDGRRGGQPRSAPGVRRAAAVPGHPWRGARPAPADRRAARPAGDRLRRRRPAGAGAADPAGRTGRRRGLRQRPALRRADGLRRPARGLLRLPRRVQALHAGPHHRRVQRRCRGNTALRMALQTREQHIRREKANSNICTSQVLLANIASLYAVYHGPQGLKRIAQRVHRLTAVLAAGLAAKGLKPVNQHFFDTLTFDVGAQQQAIVERARAARVNLRIVGEDRLGVSLDETTSAETLASLFDIFLGAGHGLDVAQLDAGQVADGIPAALQRSSDYLTHPVFNRHHSETEMLRYLRQLEGKDLALNQAMIPLGSCTMKLNATQRDDPDHLAGIRRAAPVRAARAGRGLPPDDRRAGKLAAARSPATTPSACSRTPARRANTPACWRSATTTKAAAKRTATSA